MPCTWSFSMGYWSKRHIWELPTTFHLQCILQKVFLLFYDMRWQGLNVVFIITEWPYLFRTCFNIVFSGRLLHLKNCFLNGLSPPKSFIKKFLLDKKLWLFQNRVQVAPSTSCLPGSRGFSWDYSCFQGLYGHNTKAPSSEKGKAISEDKSQA